jgi:hypothetical protein
MSVNVPISLISNRPNLPHENGTTGIYARPCMKKPTCIETVTVVLATVLSDNTIGLAICLFRHIEVCAFFRQLLLEHLADMRVLVTVFDGVTALFDVEI